MTRLLRIKVIAGSKRYAIIEGSPLVLRIKETARKGAANKAAAKLLSRHFGSRVRIVAGKKSPNKTIEVL